MIAIPVLWLALASLQDPQAEAPRIWDGENVTFVRRPTPEFPVDARASRGQVSMVCTVTARGGFRNCVVESETPPGNGFARAAIVAVQRGARIEMTPDGPAEGDRVRSSIVFWNGR